MRRIVLVPILLASAALVAAQNGVSPRIERVQKAIEDYMAQNKVTGANIAIASKGHLVFRQGFGMADVENDVPVKSNTIFRLGSVSKIITAVAVMQLVEQGKIDLDSDIRKYVPEFPEKEYVVTVRHILTHTSGVRHYRALEVENTQQFNTVAASFSRFVNDPLLHKPGEKSTYSTYAFNLLARAVETASGMSFPDYLQEYVFRVAEMTDTGMEDLRGIVKSRVRGYERLADGRLVNADFANISYKWAGGGMVSTSVDLCRLGLALMSGKLMKPETLRQMWTPQRLTNGELLAQSLGWQTAFFNDAPVVMHGGAQQGTRSVFLIHPNDEFIVSVLTNYENHNPRQLGAAIRDAWYSSPPKPIGRAGIQALKGSLATLVPAGGPSKPGRSLSPAGRPPSGKPSPHRP